MLLRCVPFYCPKQNCGQNSNDAPVTVENGTTVRNEIEIESEDLGQCNYCKSLALIVMLFIVI